MAQHDAPFRRQVTKLSDVTVKSCPHQVSPWLNSTVFVEALRQSIPCLGKIWTEQAERGVPSGENLKWYQTVWKTPHRFRKNMVIIRQKSPVSIDTRQEYYLLWTALVLSIEKLRCIESAGLLGSPTRLLKNHFGSAELRWSTSAGQQADTFGR